MSRDKGVGRVAKTYRLIVFTFVCATIIAAGCVPIQPESAETAALVPTATPSPEPTATPTPEPTATPTPEPTVAAVPTVPGEWETFVDEGRGLSIPVPPGWIFVDPSEQELSDFFAEAGELAGSDEIQELLAYIVNVMQQQGDLFVGMGFQVDSGSARDLEFLNNVNVIAVSPEGLSLPLMAKLSAAQLDAIEGIEVESAEVVAGMRPDGEETLSILSRMDGALYNLPDTAIVSWQVGLLSPDGATMLLLTFGILSEEFAALEPLLGEVVQRVHWFE